MNPALASHAFHILPYQGLGSGIPRIIKAWPQIEFQDDRRGNQFRVTIVRSAVQLGGVSGGVPALLDLIQQKPGLRVPDLAQALDTPPKTIERWITQLRTDGLVEFIGPTKTGGYHAKVGAGGTAA